MKKLIYILPCAEGHNRKEQSYYLWFLPCSPGVHRQVSASHQRDVLSVSRRNPKVCEKVNQPHDHFRKY